MNFYSKEGEAMSYTSLGGFGFSGLTTFLGPLVSGKVEVDGEEMSSVEYIAKQSESARANPGYFDPVALMQRIIKS